MKFPAVLASFLSCLLLSFPALAPCASAAPDPGIGQVLDVNGGAATVTGLFPRHWSYFRIEVPAQIGGQDVLGLELRVKNWTGGAPTLVIKRDQLPQMVGNTTSSGSLSSPQWRTDMPAGNQHSIHLDSWTLRNDPAGLAEGVDRVLTLAMGNPLEPGLYYVGIYNVDAALGCNFTFQSRAIGVGMSLPVADATVGGTVNVSGLAPRESSYFKFDVPPGMTSWEFHLGMGAGTPAGEGMLVLRKGHIPNSQQGVNHRSAPYEIYNHGPLAYQMGLRIAGPERVTLLPLFGQTEIPAGTYYAQIVSEGNSVPSLSRIGTGGVDFVLKNVFPAPVENLGSVTSGNVIRRSGQLAPGENRYFRLTVLPDTIALVVTLTDLPGKSYATLVPVAGGLPEGEVSSYGSVGGQPRRGQIDDKGMLTVPHPAPGDYFLLVRDQTSAPSEFEVGVEVQGAPELTFDGGTTTIPALQPGRWLYHRVTVPARVAGEEVLGWEIRVKNWAGGDPMVVVRRGLPPVVEGDRSASGAYSLYPQWDTTFPEGYQHSGYDRWIQRTGSNTGADRFLTLAMGNPLEPGDYYVGVLNRHMAQVGSLTVQSRAVGKGMGLHVADAAIDAMAGVSGLPSLESAYFRFEVPQGTKGWKLDLGFGVTTPDGEGLLLLRKDFIPNSQYPVSHNRAPYRLHSSGVTYQLGLRKVGGETVTILPDISYGSVPAGTYYAQIVSEGRSLSGNQFIGTGAVDFMLTSTSTLPEEDLGNLGLRSTVRRAGALAAGESRFLHFRVHPDTALLSVSLKDLPGSSSAYFMKSDGFLPYGNSTIDGVLPYGIAGGATASHEVENSGTREISNPAPGEYVMVLRDQDGSAAAEFDLEIAVQPETVPDGIPNSWEILHLGATDHGHDSDLPDQDGVPLILEYFFGMNPAKMDEVPMTIRPEAGRNIIEFRKLRDTSLLRHSVEWSDSLEPSGWSEAPAEFVKTADQGDSEIWQATLPVDDRDTQKFFRLRVTANP